MTRRVAWILVEDLSRTGVPVALARMVRWQAQGRRGDLDVHVVARRTGPLAGELRRSAASLTTLEPEVGRSRVATIAAATAELGRPAGGAAVRDRWYRAATRRLPTPEVVLVHGAGAWPLFEAFEARLDHALVVVHLHELELALSRSVDRTQRRAMFSRADEVLAVSAPVADLARSAGVGPERIHLVSGSVDDPADGWDRALSPSPTSCVLGVGAGGWRKGTDRLRAAAFELQRTSPHITCHWVGAPADPAWTLASDALDPLVGHPSCADPWSVVAAPAALVLPSREDPMPLVALEAGALGVPVIASPTGGLVELLSEGRGWLVPGHDIAALASTIADLVAAPAAAAERATALRHHVHQHFRTSVVGPRWLAVLTGG